MEETLSTRLTVKEASIALDIPEQAIRIGMQRGLLNIGYATKENQQYAYYISTNLVKEYGGEAAIQKLLNWRKLNEKKTIEEVG